MAISLLVQLPQPWHFLLLLAGLLLAVVSYLLVTRRDPEERGLRLPPGPARVPLLGNLHQLGPLPHHSLRDLAGRHGPVMLLRLCRVLTLVVSSANAAREVLQLQDHAFANRSALASHGGSSTAARTSPSRPTAPTGAACARSPCSTC